MVKNMTEVPKVPHVLGGSMACPGCPAVLALRLALDALGSKTIVVNASGCMTLLCNYPFTPLKVPWLHNAIENVARRKAAKDPVAPVVSAVVSDC